MHSHLSPNISLVTLLSMQNNNKIMFLFIRSASTWSCSTVTESTLAMNFEVAAPEKKFFVCSYCFLRNLTYEKFTTGKHYFGSAVLLVCTVLFCSKRERF